MYGSNRHEVWRRNPLPLGTWSRFSPDPTAPSSTNSSQSFRPHIPSPYLRTRPNYPQFCPCSNALVSVIAIRTAVATPTAIAFAHNPLRSMPEAEPRRLTSNAQAPISIQNFKSTPLSAVSRSAHTDRSGKSYEQLAVGFTVSNREIDKGVVARSLSLCLRSKRVRPLAWPSS